MRIWAFLFTLLLAACPQACPAQDAAPHPTIAVYFEQSSSPQSDLQQFVDDVVAKLVQSGKFSVVDRAHVEAALKAQPLTPQGQVVPTGAPLGRILGVSYMVMVGIDQLGAVNQFQREATLFNNQQTWATRIDLADHLSLFDARSGRTIQSLDDKEQATSGLELASSLKASSQQFINDQVPALIEASATNLFAKLPTLKFVPTAPPISGHVLGVEGNQVFLSLKASDGIIVGEMLDFFDAKTAVKLGTLQITEVDAQYSIAKPVAGTPLKLELVVPE